MNTKSELGTWILTQANVSFRYWHSSKSCRKNMKKPFFDRNQCQEILAAYEGKEDKLIA